MLKLLLCLGWCYAWVGVMPELVLCLGWGYTFGGNVNISTTRYTYLTVNNPQPSGIMQVDI